MSLSPIRRVISETTNWANEKMFVVERVDSKGIPYEGTITPATLEIINMLAELEIALTKCSNKSLSADAVANIRKAIESYGEENYAIGYNEADSYHNNI